MMNCCDEPRPFTRTALDNFEWLDATTRAANMEVPQYQEPVWGYSLHCPCSVVGHKLVCVEKRHFDSEHIWHCSKCNRRYFTSLIAEEMRDEARRALGAGFVDNETLQLAAVSSGGKYLGGIE